MKLQTTFLIFTTLVAASFASTVSNILADLKTIRTQASDQHDAIQRFRNIDLFTNAINALTIQTDSGRLIDAINKATADLNALPFKPVVAVDAQKILATFQTIEPTIIDTLNLVVSQKSVLASIPIPGAPYLVKEDLVEIKNSAALFVAALSSSVPADIIPAVQAIETSINPAFDTAIAAYS